MIQQNRITFNASRIRSEQRSRNEIKGKMDEH